MNIELSVIPFLALFYREIRRFMKVFIQTILTPLVTASLYFLIFGLSLDVQLADGTPYLAFLIPGVVMMGCLNNSFQNTSSSVVSSKFTGELEDYKVAPLGSQQFVWALSFGGLIRGVIVSVVTFLVGQLFYYNSYDRFLSVIHPFYLFFFLLVGGLSFAKLGLSVAIWARTFDQMMAVNGFLITPLIYLGGVFFSLETLSNFWQQVSMFNPLLYLINGVRYAILGHSDVSVGVAIVVVVLTLGVFHLLALYSMKAGAFFRW